MFLSGLKVWMALMRPIVPIEIRSSMWMPVFSNRRAMYTTSRRLCSMSREAASLAPGGERPDGLLLGRAVERGRHGVAPADVKQPRRAAAPQPQRRPERMQSFQ